jgi:membrane protein involved in colicin uptake
MLANGIIHAVNGSAKKQTLTDPETGLQLEMQPAKTGKVYPMKASLYERLRRTHPWLTRAHVHEARETALAEKAIADNGRAKAEAEESKRAADAQAQADQEAAEVAKAEAEAAEAASQEEFERRYQAMLNKQGPATPAG